MMTTNLQTIKNKIYTILFYNAAYHLKVFHINFFYLQIFYIQEKHYFGYFLASDRINYSFKFFKTQKV